MSERRRSAREARFERIVWFMMVGVFLLLSFDEQSTIPSYFAPVSLGIILLYSGVYQSFKRWRVSPLTWILMTLFFVIGGIDVWLSNNPNIRFPFDGTLFSLIITSIFIGMTAFSNEG